MSLLLAISGGTPTADVQGAVQLDGVTVAGTLWGVARISGAVTLGDVTVAGVMGQPVTFSVAQDFRLPVMTSAYSGSSARMLTTPRRRSR